MPPGHLAACGAGWEGHRDRLELTHDSPSLLPVWETLCVFYGLFLMVSMVTSPSGPQEGCWDSGGLCFD